MLTDVAAEESLLAGGFAHSGMARAARPTGWSHESTPELCFPTWIVRHTWCGTMIYDLPSVGHGTPMACCSPPCYVLMTTETHGNTSQLPQWNVATGCLPSWAGKGIISFPDIIMSSCCGGCPRFCMNDELWLKSSEVLTGAKLLNHCNEVRPGYPFHS